MKLDEISRLATFPAETSLSEAQESLQKRGFSLGFSPKIKKTSLLKILEEKTPNQWGLLYGEIDDICISVRVNSDGQDWTTKKVPRAATGPDLKKILIGSGGRYGVITEATFRVVPLPEMKHNFDIVWKNTQDRDTFMHLLWSASLRPLQMTFSGEKKLVISLEGSEECVNREASCIYRFCEQTSGSEENERIALKKELS